MRPHHGGNGGDGGGGDEGGDEGCRGRRRGRADDEGGRRATRIEVRDRRPRGARADGRVLAVRRRKGGLGDGDEGGEKGGEGEALT